MRRKSNQKAATSNKHQALNAEMKAEAEKLITAGDELMAAIGELRDTVKDFPTPPLKRILDRILDARSNLMKLRDAAPKGKAVAA